MPEILEKDLKNYAPPEARSRIKKTPEGAWYGLDNPGHYYTHYREAYWANVKAVDLKIKKENGLNEQGQTFEQETAFKLRLEKAKELKAKAELATELAMQTKSGLKVR